MNSDGPIVCYGNDGPAFERKCKSCGRFLKFPKTMKWKEDFSGMCKFQKVNCEKCGKVEPWHIGWSGDFR